MKKRELISFFKEKYESNGGVGGDWCFILKDDSEGDLQIYPSVRDVVGSQYINGFLVMRPGWYKKLSNIIYEAQRGPYLFTASNTEIVVRPESGVASEEDIKKLISISFSWFDECNESELVAAELRAKYEAYDRPGGWQFTHIISCVLKGDVKKLRFYLESFERGDRMGFIPIIKQEYFERAIPLAEKYSSGELKPPVIL